MKENAMRQPSGRYMRQLFASIAVLALSVYMIPVFDEVDVHRYPHTIDLSEIILQMAALERTALQPDSFSTIFQIAFRTIRQSAGIDTVIHPYRSYGWIYRTADAMDRPPATSTISFIPLSFQTIDILQRIVVTAPPPPDPPPESASISPKQS